LAQTLPTQRFYARGKTSFSYLAQHLKHKATRADRLANIDTDFEQAEDELNLAEWKIATAQPIAWIKQYFRKGLWLVISCMRFLSRLIFSNPTCG
jgi:exodeoxyribonuclease V beta subunit